MSFTCRVSGQVRGVVDQPVCASWLMAATRGQTSSMPHCIQRALSRTCSTVCSLASWMASCSSRATRSSAWLALQGTGSKWDVLCVFMAARADSCSSRAAHSSAWLALQGTGI